MSDTAHTQGEWTKDDEGGRLHPSCRIIDGNGLLVATGILPEHAERIVLCCNAHDDLVAALEALYDAMPDCGEGPLGEAAVMARRAMKKVRGEK